MSDHPKSLMLFAAGKGTRMGSLTASKPKPLIRVAGRPLIDHALDMVRGAGIPNVVVNVHHFAEQVIGHLRGTAVEISDEKNELLETGGGLRCALPLLGPGPVLTLNSDAVWTGPNPLTQLLTAWEPDHMDALLLLVEPAKAIGHNGPGDFVRDAEFRLRRGPDLVYAGAQILKTDLLSDIPERAFSLNRVWDTMLSRERLYGIVHPGGWCDVGTPEGIEEAEAMLKVARDV